MFLIFIKDNHLHFMKILSLCSIKKQKIVQINDCNFYEIQAISNRIGVPLCCFAVLLAIYWAIKFNYPWQTYFCCRHLLCYILFWIIQIISCAHFVVNNTTVTMSFFRVSNCQTENLYPNSLSCMTSWRGFWTLLTLNQVD